MVFGFFKKRREVENKVDLIHKTISSSFANIKDDMDKVNSWIEHFHSKHNEQDDRHNEVFERLKKIEDQMEYLFDSLGQGNVSKHGRTDGRTWTDGQPKRTAVRVQTDVQDDVDEVFRNLDALKNLSINEIKLVKELLLSELKLSYRDLCVLLNKDESTLRGQIGNIKIKTPNLIKERLENDGRKRFYIDQGVKEKILKKEDKIKEKHIKSSKKTQK